MSKIYRKAAISAGAVLAGVGVLGAASAPAASISVDGWDISWSTGVTVSAAQDSVNASQVDVTKMATFTAPNQGYQITFVPISGYTGTAATQFVIPTEMITNNTGASFNGFSFVLLNTTSDLATFDSVARTFIPPAGSGYNFTSVSLDPGNTILTYTGTQDNGVTSTWGNGDASSTGDNLLIDAPAGSDFSLKELSSSGSGPGPVVPLPAAAWQSLVGLGGLALIGLRRRIKQRRLA